MKKLISIVITFLFVIKNIFSSEEIFLSVTKEGISEKFIPSNAIIITRKDIENTNAKNVGELLEILTSYDVGRIGTLGSAKTLRLRYSSSDQTLILINNIPLNSNGKSAFNLSLIPTEIVEKIEILPASSSALYGANALGGIVNIITKQAKEKNINTNLSYGSFNTYILNANLEFNKPSYTINATATNQHSDGWRKNSKYDSLSGYLNFSLPVMYGKFFINIISNNSDSGIPGPANIPINQWNGEIEREASIPYAKQNDNFNIFTLGYEDKIVSSKLSFDIQKLIYDNSQDSFWPDKTDSNLNAINFLNTLTLPYKFFVSLNYNYTKINQQYPLNPNDNFEKDLSNLGVALQKKFKYENLNFIPTLRWDSNSLFGNKLSPQVIFTYNIHQTKLSLITGTSWRTPTFLDLYWPNQIWVRGNPDLKPEESYSVDFAVEKKIQEVLFSVNLFYRYIKDQIRWYPEDPQNPWSAWTPSNIDETFVQGSEIKSCFTIAKIFKNQLSMLISDSRIKKKGEEEKGWQIQAYSPFLTLCYSSDLLLPYGFSLVNIAKYVDTQYSGDNESGTKLNSYILWNLRVEKKVFNFLNTYIQITDLFDQKCVNRVGYPQPGRNYEFGINVNIKI